MLMLLLVDISYNYIRKHNELFYDYVWIGSDDYDRFNTVILEEIKDYIIRNNFTTDKIFLTQKYQNIKTGIKRYAVWSFLFSPIYYNNISFRTAPMNKEDLDFFNRLIVNSNNVVNLYTNMKLNEKMFLINI